MLAKEVFQCTAEKEKSVVHVNHHTHSSGHEQIGNVSRAIQFLLCAMTISNCVYPQNEVNRAIQIGFLCPSGRRKVVDQPYVLSEVVSYSPMLVLPKVVIR